MVRDTPMPQYCLMRAVVATSLVLVGQKRTALPLSAAQLAASVTAGSPLCCSRNLNPASGLAVGLPNPAIPALPQRSRLSRSSSVPTGRLG